MKMKIYKALYGYALECKSRKEMEKKEKNRSERSNLKKYELTNRPQHKNLQKNR